MTWGNNSVFQILIIQGSQAVTGLFLYNGLGAPGNPPQFAAVASTVTTDPFGNAITSSKILIQGNVITESGGIFRTAAAAPLIQLDGPHNAVLVYDAAAVLRETIAPVITGDGLGNTVQPGFTAYGTGLFAQLTAAALQWGGTGITASPVVGSGSAAQIQLSSGQTAANTVECILSLNSAAAGVSGTALLTGVLELANALATPAAAAGGPVAFGGGGQLRVVDSADGVNYGTERLLQNISGTLPQVISSTTPANIQGLTIAVSANRTYRVRGRLSCTIGGTATTVNLDLAGPAVTTMEIGFWKAQNNPGGATLFTATQTAISTSTQIFSVNEGAGNAFTVFFEGTVTFSAAGTMTLQAAEHTAAQTWQLNANSYWEVAPE